MTALSDLPPLIADRAGALNARPIGDGPIVYLMRTALRTMENPALEAAAALASARSAPAIVFQGLAADEPFANDRRFRFALEGVGEIAAALAERGFGFGLHLAPAGRLDAALDAIAAVAGAVVVEDHPLPFARDPARALATRAPCAVIAVDAACVAPMRMIDDDAVDRAFRFRKATKALYKARLPLVAAPAGRPAAPADPGAFGLPLADWTADVDALVAGMAIDHAVGPVPHTPGGMTAAQARWAAFRDGGGLTAYAAKRNDALIDGVSRLSPYLRWGMIAPFQIAREAHAIGGAGAEKFLDELLIWREMAWAWAWRTADPDVYADIVPDWARESFARRSADRRPIRLDRERLARADSGDALWDAAQASLLIQGELHNNMRMTWGKAPIRWSPDAETALARILDLNHRYALDGLDPNSYGGVLWCFGRFDRPFDPEEPIMGRVRGRSTAVHAQRLPPAQYGAKTRRPLFSDKASVAVIGAGFAGLAAARTLSDHGVSVTLFDKGRGPAGRASTRRVTLRDGREIRFDHGLQAFRATDPRFLWRAEAWAERGLIAPFALGDDRDLFVPTGTAHALPATLLDGLDPQWGVRIANLRRDGAGWRLTDQDGGRRGVYAAVICAAPAPQTAVLLAEAAPDLAARAAVAVMAPCWTAMAAYERRPEGFPDQWSAPGVDLAIWEETKPHRSADAPARLVIDADAAWSRAHLNEETDRAAAALIAGLDLPTPAYLTAHRWRYAFVETGAETGGVDGCLWDGAAALAAAGDWCGSAAAGDPRGGVQAASLSGEAAAGRVLAAFTASPDPIHAHALQSKSRGRRPNAP